jgi:hypothetical protein
LGDAIRGASNAAFHSRGLRARHQLDSFVTLEKSIAFYVEQHNSVVPHSAFAGQTPDEMCF